jgi:transposase-like protein
MNAFNLSESEQTTSDPPARPACRSASVTTTAKHPDVSSYWRCHQCGKIWNTGRRDNRP